MYYVFEEPIDLFPNIKLQMKSLKKLAYQTKEMLYDTLLFNRNVPLKQGDLRVFDVTRKEAAANSVHVNYCNIIQTLNFLLNLELISLRTNNEIGRASCRERVSSPV